MSQTPRIVLASASARRSALLAQLKVPHHVCPAQIAEHRLAGESIAQCVQRLAQHKAEIVWALLNAGAANAALVGLPVLGADTVVVLGELMLGKPRDREDALRMLGLLSGREHEVLSAVAVRTAAALQGAECEAYWDSGEPADKAGAYAVQGLGAIFVETLQGSYSGVMGLPLFETAALLAGAGVAVLGSRKQRDGARG
jgi:septum formation protein